MDCSECAAIFQVDNLLFILMVWMALDEKFFV
jgi:hypothetical protein